MAADDCVPAFVTKVDPSKGPVDVALEKRNLDNLGPKNQLRGRVVNPDGEAIPGAVVSFEFYYGDQANCGGACEGVDPLAVTDASGLFLIATTKRFDWMTVSVEARSYAKRKFFKLPSGKNQDLKVTEGATVKGRVLRDGKPMKNVEVGLVSVDRSENFTGEFVIGTDEDGVFQFLNIPSYQIYYLYSHSSSLKGVGTISIKKIRVSADRSTKDAGEISIEPGLRLMGRVKLSDGAAIPLNTRVMLGREDAWDSAIADVAPDGRFEFTHLPAGSVSLGLRLDGYRISEKNKNLDRLNGGTIVGRIDQDIIGLELLMEPGKFTHPDFNKPGGFGPDMQPRDKPLRGAESPSL